MHRNLLITITIMGILTMTIMTSQTTGTGYVNLTYTDFYNVSKGGYPNGAGYANVTTLQNCGNWNNGTSNFDPHANENDNPGFLKNGFYVVDNNDLDLCTAGNGATKNNSRDDSALLLQDMDVYNGTAGFFYNFSNSNVTAGQKISAINFSVKVFAKSLEVGDFCNITFANGTAGDSRIWYVGNNSGETANTSAQGYVPGLDTALPGNVSYANFVWNKDCATIGGCTKNMSIRLTMMGIDNNDFCYFDNYNLTVYTTDISAGSTCTCPSINTNWVIGDGSTCQLTSNCDLGTGKVQIMNGKLRVEQSARLWTKSIYVNNISAGFYGNYTIR